MVGYNDEYNRSLTARSNALQRRKGFMIDALNGSGRGDDDDDYLSEDYGMEGGGYDDDYEDEMVGGSFEEASREVGGRRHGRMKGGILPFLAAAAAPLVGSLVSKLFGGRYTGGAKAMKAQMVGDAMELNNEQALVPYIPKLADLAMRVGKKTMKDARFREPMIASGGMRTGGRATGGFAFLAPLAMAAAPALGSAIGRLFGLGRNSPIMRGEGFFDFISNAGRAIGNVLAPVGNFLKPVADAVLPAVGNLAKDAAVGFIKKKIGGKKCCSCQGGAAMYSPYELAYEVPRSGSMRAKGRERRSAQDFFDRDDERIGMEVRGLRDAERRNEEKRYALGAGGKRLYMRGGTAPLAPMGDESLGGFDNDEQPYGLTPPRNVATRGYLSGMRGGRMLVPEDQMFPTVGGGVGRGGASAWIQHVKAYQKQHGVSYKEALSKASATYRK